MATMNPNMNGDACLENTDIPSILTYNPDQWTLNQEHQPTGCRANSSNTDGQVRFSSSADKDQLAAFYSSLSMPVSIREAPTSSSNGIQPAPVSDGTASFSSISSWYDPLESIISSTSTSLTNSPSSNLNMMNMNMNMNMNTAMNMDMGINMNTNMNTDISMNDCSQQQFLLDTHPHSMHFINMNNNDYNDSNTNNNNNNNSNNINNNIGNNINDINSTIPTSNNIISSHPTGGDTTVSAIPVKHEEEETDQATFDFFTVDLENEIRQPPSSTKNELKTEVRTEIKESVKLSSRPQRKRLTPHQKQAHNKIEKRYRININTKIARLQQIIPWVSSEQTAFEVSDSLRSLSQSGNPFGIFAECGADRSLVSSMTGSPNSTENGSTGVSFSTITPSTGSGTGTGTGTTTRLNKSMILEKAVDYILYLQNNERLYEMEVARLRQEVEGLRRINDVANSQVNNNTRD